jgi:putative cell wall-binding protein
VVVSTADCSASELRVLQRDNGTFVGGTDTLVAASAPGTRFETASWRPLTPLAQVTRLGGQDRIGTALAVSRWGWPKGSNGAVLASATTFADAVVAGPLAAQGQMPLLLTGGNSLNSRALAELGRLMPGPDGRFVYLVGGTGALGASIEKTLVSKGFAVKRVAGADRFSTSVKVAHELDEAWQGALLQRSTAFLADGTNFPDALSAGPAATTALAPVLLTNRTKVPPAVASYVNGRRQITTVYGIGGNAAAAAQSLTAKSRRIGVVGADRYETGQKVAQTFFPGGSSIGYASGQSFADALTGGALMGTLWEPLLLVKPSSMPTVVGAQADRYKGGTDAVLLFGGTGAVSDGVKRSALDHAGRQTALYGPTTPLVPNADVQVAHGAKGTRAGADAAIEALPQGNGAKSRPEALRGFRSAAER